MIVGFFLGILATVAIFLFCMWIMRPEEFKTLMRSIGGGGVKPPKK